MGLYPKVYAGTRSVLEPFRFIPPIAWIPLAIIFFSGLTRFAFLIFLGAFFPIFTSTLVGVARVEPIHRKVGVVHGASKFWILRNVVVPTVLPDIMAGMRVGLGTAWLTIVAAELAGGISTGLGRMMINYAELLQVPQVIVGMLLIGLIGFLDERGPAAGGEVAVPLALAGQPVKEAAHMHGQAPMGTNAKVQVDASHRYGDLVVHERSAVQRRRQRVRLHLRSVGLRQDHVARHARRHSEALAGASPDRRRTCRPEAAKHLVRVPGAFDVPLARRCATTWRRDCASRARASADIDAKVREIVEIVGLTGFENYYPHQISGGMKQRVAIARAFATDADLILMDEPFVSLDQPTRERMQREVLDIWRHRKRTVIFVTHNLEEAVFLGDRILILSAKPARIVAELPVRLRASARSALVRVHGDPRAMRALAARASEVAMRRARARDTRAQTSRSRHNIRRQRPRRKPCRPDARS